MHRFCCCLSQSPDQVPPGSAVNLHGSYCILQCDFWLELIDRFAGMGDSLNSLRGKSKSDGKCNSCKWNNYPAYTSKELKEGLDIEYWSPQTGVCGLSVLTKQKANTGHSSCWMARASNVPIPQHCKLEDVPGLPLRGRPKLSTKGKATWTPPRGRSKLSTKGNSPLI